MWSTLLLILACGGPAAGDPCAPGPEPSLAIGDGRGAYTPLEDGDVIELVHGPQGGYHLELGFEAVHVAAEELVVVEVFGETASGLQAAAAPWVELTCDEDAGALRSFGSLLVFEALPEDLDGQPVSIEAELVDNEGAAVQATLDLVISDPLLDR